MKRCFKKEHLTCLWETASSSCRSSALALRICCSLASISLCNCCNRISAESKTKIQAKKYFCEATVQTMKLLGHEYLFHWVPNLSSNASENKSKNSRCPLNLCTCELGMSGHVIFSWAIGLCQHWGWRMLLLVWCASLLSLWWECDVSFLTRLSNVGTLTY